MAATATPNGRVVVVVPEWLTRNDGGLELSTRISRLIHEEPAVPSAADPPTPVPPATPVQLVPYANLPVARHVPASVLTDRATRAWSSFSSPKSRRPNVIKS